MVTHIMFIPFLRYARCSQNLINPFFVKAYDARFFYVLQGSAEYLLKDETYTLFPGDLMYSPPGISYFPRSNAQDLEFISINFDFEQTWAHIVNTLPPVPEDQFQPERCHTPQLSPQVQCFASALYLPGAQIPAQDLLRMTECFAQKRPFSQEQCSAMLAFILYRILECQAARSTSRIVSDAADYIAHHYMQPIDNNVIAQALGYHPYYLNTVFRNIMGTTLHRYLLRTRIQAACTMLIDTELPISSIAASCGFTNPEHFCNVFRRSTSVTPSEYRSRTRLV